MKKRWINCTDLLKYHDVTPAESVQAITSGDIDAYSSQLRKIVDARNYELKKNVRDVILSELDRIEQDTGKRPLVSFSPDMAHVGEFLGTGAEKIIKNRWENNFPTYYVIHQHGTLPINFGWLERILQNQSIKQQCEELGFVQFKYEDAVRCFGLHPKDDAATPVTRINNTPAADISAAETTNNSTPDDKKKRKYKCGNIKQTEAASMCNVSLRLMSDWVSGKDAPEDFPGLFDPIVFRQWAETYRRKKVNKQIAVSMNNAIPVDPKIIEELHSDSAFTDTSGDGDTRSLDELIEEQKKEKALEDKKRRGRRP